ncbi:coat protein [Obuda pepper virus]|uniref:Capsid protein n=1 Tax=Tobamovirus Ob TaxID=31749 RepID=CAPSD_TMOB|nr:coat protein [Obuda pepper virus]Q83486.3 RecName: Full=Capsid protein; AltName: Full=Coat protein [Obuda pepper virus]pir/JQ2146/ coat protein - tomato mosaic virus (strain Ob) [Tomato mosaic virus]pir/JQ2160/ coat protein - tomato mosaic virus (strain Ob) [Tomato mosaic virus]WMX25357.1 coat protein [Obuda pepper virus]BAA02703.1 coat protein [Obuda pepper virus]
MPYTVTSPSQLVYFGSVWADPITFIDLCTVALGNQFQTQNARTTVQQQFSDLFKTVPTRTNRFNDGENGFRVFRYNSTLDPLISALMNSFDTRNRIIEVDNPANPNTSEVASATQRVDDATVNIRACINNLMNELVRGTGMMNTASFETVSNLTWTTTTTT